MLIHIDAGAAGFPEPPACVHYIQRFHPPDNLALFREVGYNAVLTRNQDCVLAAAIVCAVAFHAVYQPKEVVRSDITFLLEFLNKGVVCANAFIHNPQSLIAPSVEKGVDHLLGDGILATLLILVDCALKGGIVQAEILRQS